MTQEQYATKSQYDRLAFQVDLLDKELRVLKAQIQATLLAIHERMLNDKYPVLGEGAQPHSRPQTDAQPREWHVKKYGLDQVKAVPGVYSVDDDPELASVPPFDPPIMADDAPYSSPSNRLSVEDSDWQAIADALTRGQHSPNGSRNGANNGAHREHSNGSSPRATPQDWMREARHAPPTPAHPSPGWQQDIDQQAANGSPLAEMLERLGFKRPTPDAPSTGRRDSYNNASSYQETPDYPPSKSAQQLMPGGSYQRESDRDSQQPPLQVWLELDKWVSEKVKEVGIAGALELAHLYGGQERETLLRLVAIYQERLANAAAAVAAPGTPPQLQPVQPPPASDIPWKNRAEANKAKYATYRPFGEHQELVLQLLEQVLRSRNGAPGMNGNHNRR